MSEIKKSNKAQSIIEYAVLLTVVSGAIIAMYLYINRTVQARLKQVESEINEPINVTL